MRITLLVAAALGFATLPTGPAIFFVAACSIRAASSDTPTARHERWSRADSGSLDSASGRKEQQRRAPRDAYRQSALKL